MQASVEARVAMTDAEGGPETLPGVAPPIDLKEPLLRHREGDPEAFAVLVADYRRPVYSYLIRCGVREGDRDDLFQSVFLRIHRAAARYRADLPAHPWIFTIVVNQVRSYLRSRRVRDLLFAAAVKHEPPDPAPDGERTLQAQETVAWLEAEIRRLPLPQREVLILASLEGRPLNEVAQALGLPLNTVKTHLRRTRLMLSEKLARRHAVGSGKEQS